MNKAAVPNAMRATDVNASNYFEQIGFWPKGATHIWRAYALGFVLSFALTLAAYWIVTSHSFALSQEWIFIGIALLAIVQFAVQMMCFLHIGKGSASRDRLIALGFAGVIVLIVVGGSLWIMSSLNARMMPSDAQMEQYMDTQTGL